MKRLEDVFPAWIIKDIEAGKICPVFSWVVQKEGMENWENRFPLQLQVSVFDLPPKLLGNVPSSGEIKLPQYRWQAMNGEVTEKIREASLRFTSFQPKLIYREEVLKELWKSLFWQVQREAQEHNIRKVACLEGIAAIIDIKIENKHFTDIAIVGMSWAGRR